MSAIGYRSAMAIGYQRFSDYLLDQSCYLSFTLTYNTPAGRLQCHCCNPTMALLTRFLVSEDNSAGHQVSPNSFTDGLQFENVYWLAEQPPPRQ